MSKSFMSLLIAISVIILMITVFIVDFRQRTEGDSNEYFHHTSISAAQQHADFLADYRPMNKKIKLKYHSDSVLFKRLWMEVQTVKRAIWLGPRDNRRHSESEFPVYGKIYFQIDYEQYPTNEYVFDIDGHGSRGGRGTFDLDELPDTIKFEIIEKNPVDSLGWSHYLRSMQIVFVKKPNLKDSN